LPKETTVADTGTTAAIVTQTVLTADTVADVTGTASTLPAGKATVCGYMCYGFAVINS